MTTPYKFEVKNLVNGMLFGTLVVMLMLTTVGCDKKKSNNNNGNNICRQGQICGGPGFGQPGFGQPGFGNGIFGVGYDQYSGAEVVLEFVTGGAHYNDPYFASGQTYIYGQISMQNGMQCGYGGGVQPDIYSLETTYPGNSQNGVVSNAQLIGYGQYGGQITIQVNYAIIQSPYGGVGGGQYLPLMGTLTVITANGVPCNQMMSIQP